LTIILTPLHLTEANRLLKSKLHYIEIETQILHANLHYHMYVSGNTELMMMMMTRKNNILYYIFFCFLLVFFFSLSDDFVQMLLLPFLALILLMCLAIDRHLLSHRIQGINRMSSSKCSLFFIASAIGMTIINLVSVILLFDEIRI